MFDRRHASIHRFLWSRTGDAADDLAAEALDVPIGTVRSRLHRARTQVRERLAHDDADRGDEA